MRILRLVYIIFITLLVCFGFSKADETLTNEQTVNQEKIQSVESSKVESLKDTVLLKNVPAKNDTLRQQEKAPKQDIRIPFELRPKADPRPQTEPRPQPESRPQSDTGPPNDKRPAVDSKQTVAPVRVQSPNTFQKDKYLNPPPKYQKPTIDIKTKTVQTQETEINNLQVFPDEYSELDDYPSNAAKDNDVILKTLEHARQKYVQAIILVQKGDTTNASGYFEKAIEILNRLTGYPGIEKNQNFTDLATSIMDDYENFVGSIENLDDNSPFFAIREKLFKEIEFSEAVNSPKIVTIELPKDTSVSLVGSKPLVPEPKLVVIPLDENEEVLKNIAFLTEEGKKGGKRFFKKWLERTTKWFPMMRRIAAEEGMPEELIYLSLIESGLRPDAVSHANAVGLWQFVRTTGQDYDLNIEPSSWVDERRDPEKSTRAAMRFLKDLYGMFNDWHLALASYNCGGGRVRRTLKSFGTDTSTFWDIRDKLPKETQQYVPLYIATTKIALNPFAYGFNTDSLKFEEEYVYDTYILNEPVSLSVIAKCADTTREIIQQLNPELLRTITPPNLDSYTIKIPKNKVQLFVANYSTLSPEDKQPWIEHKVSSGESIAKIARDYDVSRNEIASANGLPSYRSKVKAGSILKIPVDKDYYAEKKRIEEDKAEIVAVSTKLADDKKALMHTVKPGESLYSIANRYGIRMTDLRNLNNIPYDDDNINVGQKLIVSQSENKPSLAGNTKTESTNDPTKPETKYIRHKVKANETLHAIAENYNLSIDAIKTTNNLKDDKILQGQMLAIEIPSASKANFSTKTSSGKTLIHEVKPDETLGTIAGIYGVSEENILKWNPDNIDGSTIFAGTLLKIEEPSISKGSAQATPKNVNKAPKYYTVKRGDTLSSLSRKFGVSIEELQLRNKGLEPDKLRVGQRVRIQ
ncbi:MAG: LysM peptidoglycan-binding domain-containing protein [bacterium]